MRVKNIRVSIGSASVLGLHSQEFKVPLTTCYLMTYIEGHCIANCGFCPQARESNSSIEKLSRIEWPVFLFKDLINRLKFLTPSKHFKRICIQALNYEQFFEDLNEIVGEISFASKSPISIATPPISKEKLKELKKNGAQRVGIALDGASSEVFEKIKGIDVKGPYQWESHFQALKDALEVFGEGFVSTHLIVGLGETQKDILKRIVELNDLKILPSLFVFTPIKGTKFENMNQPDLVNFRLMQLGRHLIINENKSIKDFAFNLKGKLININISKKFLKDIIEDTNAFLTSGCSGCNRPYYTSRPSGPIYNYPRKLTIPEKDDVYELLERFLL